VATDRIKALEENQREETKDGDFAPSEIKAE
jgi:hypothetical protein